MGKRYMIEKLSLKKQFIISIVLILVLSLICTIIGVAIYMSLLSTKVIYKPNYYESKATEVENYVEKNSDKILDRHFQKELEQVIPLKGIEYQVININGEVVYGAYKTPVVNKPIKIVSNKKIESHGYIGSEIIKYVPIKYKGNLNGMIAMRYYLRVSAKNPKYNFIAQNLEKFLMISPFAYIILFTGIFAAKFNKRLSTPIRQLIDGAKKIKDRELDFNIDYKSKNELGLLCESFEEMRIELKNTLEKQWKMEDERREMVSAIAHDLRTPITIIKGHVESLIDAKKLNEDRVYRYLNLIDKNTDRMTKLIEKMNTLNKIDNGEFSVKYKECDIINFFQEKNLDYKSLAQHKDIAFSLVIDDCRMSNKYILTDNNILSEILDNLISNSIRFTPKEGNITLKVNLEENKIIFAVSDSGCGFSKKDISNVFKRFYQGDESRSKEKGHSGLGLYIVNKLVQKLKGTIKIDNNSYGGAYVECIIPIIYY